MAIIEIIYTSKTQTLGFRYPNSSLIYNKKENFARTIFKSEIFCKENKGGQKPFCKINVSNF